MQPVETWHAASLSHEHRSSNLLALIYIPLVADRCLQSLPLYRSTDCKSLPLYGSTDCKSALATRRIPTLQTLRLWLGGLEKYRDLTGFQNLLGLCRNKPPIPLQGFEIWGDSVPTLSSSYKVRDKRPPCRLKTQSPKCKFTAFQSALAKLARQMYIIKTLFQ